MNNNNLVYKDKLGASGFMRFVKAVAFPFIALAVSMYSINLFGAYGTKLIAPMTAVMWVIGTVVAILMPAQQKGTLDGMLTTIICYQATIIGLRYGIYWTSGVSTEMLTASFGEAFTLSGSNAVPGFLQTSLNITSVMLPLGYIAMQVKKVVQFRKSVGKDKFFNQLRSIRDNDKK